MIIVLFGLLICCCSDSSCQTVSGTKLEMHPVHGRPDLVSHCDPDHPQGYRTGIRTDLQQGQLLMAVNMLLNGSGRALRGFIWESTLVNKSRDGCDNGHAIEEIQW